MPGLSPVLVVLGQEARGGLDLQLEQGPDGALGTVLGVERAEGAEVVGSQQEFCCFPHGLDVQGAGITRGRWDQSWGKAQTAES